MTLQELYQNIGGSYEQATSVLLMDKLIDKHIRKFPNSGVGESLIAAGREMDPARIFETAHSMKGVCANLGLTGLAEAASELAEEYRPGNARKLSDAEVKEKLARLEELYNTAVEGIRRYAEA